MAVAADAPAMAVRHSLRLTPQDRDRSSLERRSERRLVRPPGIELSLGFVFRDAVPFLESAHQLLTPPLNLIEVVVGQLAPLLANPTLELRPLTFQRVLIHVRSP